MLPSRSVSLYVDGAQNPAQLDRGIARYVSEHARAVHELSPSLLHSVLLNPALPLTANLNSFLGSGLLGSGPDGRPPTTRPRMYHIMSPFEPNTAIDVMWPAWARDSRIATVVTLYDLIPLIFPEQYLVDPGMRAFYNARFGLVRHADGVLAISQTTAEDAVERLHVPEDRVHVINAGTSEHFAGMFPSAEAASAHLARHVKSVRQGFLLYVGYFEFRKNMEGLIAGFGRLPPELRERHQLVLVCAPRPFEADLIWSAADRAGLRPSDLVITGRVSDSDLGALYRACTLFVFPSFYEGFGLPMLEAMSCGAPVAASATTTGPEVLGDLEGTFEPHDPDSIASCLSALLRSPEALERLRARSQRQVSEYTWKRVAERSVDAYERVVAGTKRRARSRRSRIALVTPWPPERSWIADYNLRLATELARRGVDVDVVVRGSVDLWWAPPDRGIRLIAARDFEQLRVLHQHDRVLYCMGNSELHAYAYDLLTRRSGVVVMHDVVLVDFYRWRAGVEHPEDPEHALAECIQRMYGDRLSAEMRRHGAATLDRQAALGMCMTRDLQSLAEQFLVDSKSARDVLELDRGPSNRQVPVTVVPFGMAHVAQGPRGAAGSSPLIVGVGSVDEASGIGTLIDAFALLAAEMPTARLVIPGQPGEPGDPAPWRNYAGEHAPRANVELLGEASVERYAELLRAADLAVQVQLAPNGEVPTAVADCLAGGLPTIVTELGWASELPSNAAEKVPPGIPPPQLRDRMMRLLTDAGRRTAISQGALDHARASGFPRVADAYISALNLS